MRALLAGLLFAGAALSASGQLVPTNVPGVETDRAVALANVIKGSGIQAFTNVTLTARIGTSTLKSGGSSSAGTFSGGGGIFGIPGGLILSTGGVFNTPGPNASGGISQTNSTGGDPDLATLIGTPLANVYDKTVLEFDFVPTYPTIAFRYVFSSDEFHEWANSQYNDVFGFFVNGTAPANNIARIPGTASPVSINNVNGGNPIGTNPQNAQYFVNNSPQVFNVEMDGLTVVLTAQTAVTPGVVNHIKIAIADVADSSFDSNVFIEQSSFMSGNSPVAINDGYKTPINTTLIVDNSGVLANDTDADDNLQRAQLIVSPAHGTVVLNAAGGFTYTPVTAYSGPDSFTYQAVDASNIQSNVATVAITVGASNTDPTSDTSTVAVPKNAVSPLPLTGFIFNDIDTGNSLTAIKIQSMTLPSGSTLQVADVDVVIGQFVQAVVIRNGGLKFSPAPGDFGPSYASVVYQVSDGVSLSAAQTLIIDVLNVFPEIAVSGNSTPITNGDAIPSAGDHTDFGSVKTSSGTINRIFTIANGGTAGLKVQNVTVTGAHAADFDVSIQPATNVPVETFTTFAVQFDPSANGLRTATLNFTNSDGDDSPFQFAIRGTGLDSIPTLASIAPSSGSAAGGTSVVLTGTNFTGTNAVSFGGAAATSFTVNSDTQITAITGARAIGVVNVVATNLYGTATGVGLYTYVAPEIAVEQPLNTSLVDGSASIAFGSLDVGTPSAPRTFTIRNSGTADLTLGAFTKNGSHPDDFSLSAPGSTTIIPGGETTFSVTFTPGGVNARSAVLRIANNDGNENPFDITLTGAGLPGPPTVITGLANPITTSSAVLNGTVSANGAATSATFLWGTTNPPTTETTVTSVNSDGAAVSRTLTGLAGYTVYYYRAKAVNSKGTTLGAVQSFSTLETPGAFTFQALTTTASLLNYLGQPETVPVTIDRLTGAIGAVTVEITASPHNAKGGPLGGVKNYVYGVDYQFQTESAPGRALVSFAAGQRSAIVYIQLLPPSLTLRGKFNLTLSNPTGGAVLGAIPFTTMVMSPVDVAGPGIKVTTAFTSVTSPFDLVGTVSDVYGLHAFTVTVNGVSTPLTVNPVPAFVKNTDVAFQIATIVPENGPNNITIEAMDTSGNRSTLVKTFNYVNQRPELAGAFNARLVPTGTPSMDTSGYISLVVTSTGSFTGRVTLSGTNLALFTGTLDNARAARFNSGTTTTINLTDSTYLGALGFTISATDGLTGTLAASSGGITLASFSGKVAPYSTTNLVPAALLNQTSKGYYTIAFPSKTQTPALATTLYPQGDGYATLSLSNVGTATLTGILADGTTYTGSGALRSDRSVALFTLLYTSGGSFAGDLVFADLTDSDVSGTQFLWLRPALPAATHYADGWPTGVTVDAIGAAYNTATKVQASLGLGAVDAVNGNSELMFTDGKLTAPITKTTFNINANVVTKIPATDATYTLVPLATSGLFSGTFTPNWTPAAAVKPAFKGILIQKGASKGGYGYFLSNAVGDTSAQGGGVTLGAP